MSNQDGFTTLKQLKDDFETKRIPVLMLTNLSNEMDKKEALRLGAVGYFVKSDTIPGDIMKIVKKIIKD